MAGIFLRRRAPSVILGLVPRTHGSTGAAASESTTHDATGRVRAIAIAIGGRACSSNLQPPNLWEWILQ
jgi:hypothetical protein